MATSTSSQLNAVEAQAHEATTEVIPWVVWLARFGYAAKGLVYITMGALAIQVAMGSGGKTTGPTGALDSLENQPFGQVLLALIAVGLGGYALWRFVQAWIDPEHEGSDAKGLVKRIGFAVSGIIYSAFAFEAVRLVMGTGSGSNENEQARDWTARLMSQPFGIWLVGIVGLIIIGTGLYQLYGAYTAKFRKELKLHEMNQEEICWTTRAGRLGFAARGIIYSIIGTFLIIAAIRINPDEAVGIGEALQKVAQQPYGPWLLGFVALGLIAYGFFAVVLARYRRIFIPA